MARSRHCAPRRRGLDMAKRHSLRTPAQVGAQRTPTIYPGPGHTWLWVTRPTSTSSTEGTVLDGLDLAVGVDGSWTCDPRTTSGDLALVYRTAPLSDVAYLLRVDSDALPIDAEDVRIGTSTHTCRYTVVAAFNPTLPFRDISSAPEFQHWGAVRTKFRGSTFEVPTDIWEQLLSRLP